MCVQLKYIKTTFQLQTVGKEKTVCKSGSLIQALYLEEGWNHARSTALWMSIFCSFRNSSSVNSELTSPVVMDTSSSATDTGLPTPLLATEEGEAKKSLCTLASPGERGKSRPSLTSFSDRTHTTYHVLRSRGCAGTIKALLPSSSHWSNSTQCATASPRDWENRYWDIDVHIYAPPPPTQPNCKHMDHWLPVLVLRSKVVESSRSVLLISCGPLRFSGNTWSMLARLKMIGVETPKPSMP